MAPIQPKLPTAGPKPDDSDTSPPPPLRSGNATAAGSRNTDTQGPPSFQRANAVVFTGLQKDLLLNDLNSKPVPGAPTPSANTYANTKSIAYLASTYTPKPTSLPGIQQRPQKKLPTQPQRMPQAPSNLPAPATIPPGNQADPFELMRADSINSTLIRGLSDVKINRATLLEGNASDINDLDPKVPGFPNLHRGAAKADGDCLFYSLIHLAGPTIANHMQVPIGSLGAGLIRKHVAAQLVSDFQLSNLGVETGELFGLLTQTGEFHEAGADKNKTHNLSDEELITLLGSSQRAQEFGSLTPNQQAHVMRVATPQQFGGITADAMPQLIANAFPALKLIVHHPDSTAESLAEYGTFSAPDGGRQQTIRLFLDNEHFEPVFEGPPKKTNSGGMPNFHSTDSQR